MHRLTHAAALLAAAAALAAPSPGLAASAAESIVEAVADPVLQQVLRDALAAGPGLRAARLRALAGEQAPAREGALPRPAAMSEIRIPIPGIRSAETEFEVGFSQEIPWRAKRIAAANTARSEATALGADADATALEVVTEARVLHASLGRLEESAAVLDEQAHALAHFEELARARYAAGAGLQAEVVKLQGEITRTNVRRIELDSQRVALRAALNALRGARPDAPLGPVALRTPPSLTISPDGLLGDLASHPELLRARAEIGAAEQRVRAAGLERRPDFEVGATYMLAGLGSASGGDVMSESDMLGVRFGVMLPSWRRRAAAMLAESSLLRDAARAEEDGARLDLERRIASDLARLDSIERRHELLGDVLRIQAEQALESALAAYSSGTVGALEVLDAERVLFEVRMAEVEIRAEHAMTVAELEGALGRPLPRHSSPPAAPFAGGRPPGARAGFPGDEKP